MEDWPCAPPLAVVILLFVGACSSRSSSRPAPMMAESATYAVTTRINSVAYSGRLEIRGDTSRLVIQGLNCVRPPETPGPGTLSFNCESIDGVERIRVGFDLHATPPTGGWTGVMASQKVTATCSRYETVLGTEVCTGWDRTTQDSGIAVGGRISVTKG